MKMKKYRPLMLRQIVGSSDSTRCCKNTDLDRNYYCLTKFIPAIM